jgi:predicted  nucleic acid-binding Zn-ribbon protein
MNKNPFDMFVELIIFDQSLHKTEKEIIHLEGEMELLEDQLIHVQGQFGKEKELLHELRKEVDGQELDMKTLDAKGKEVQERFSSASNNKEYISLKTEVEDVQKLQIDQEASLIAVWNRFEIAQKSIVTKEADYQKQKTEFDKQVEEKQQKIDELEAQLKQNEKSRPDKEQGIPEEWLEKYARMRNSVPDPVSAVEEGSCKSCYQTITNQEMLHLQRKKLLQCKGCYRFLYLTATPESEAE